MPFLAASSKAAFSMLVISSRTAMSAFSAASETIFWVSASRPCQNFSLISTMNSMSALLVTVMWSITSHSLRDLTPEAPVMPMSTVPRW